MQIRISNSIQVFFFLSLIVAGALLFFIHETKASENTFITAINLNGSSIKNWGYNNTGDYRAIYQTFKPQTTTILGIRMYISRGTTDCGSGGTNAFRYDLYSGTPDGTNTLLWSSATAGLDNTSCKALLPQTTTPSVLVDLSFGTPITVTENGNYFIKVKSSSYPSNWLYITYSSTDVYTDGTEWYEDATLHQLSGQDLVFWAYTNETVPKPTITYPASGQTIETNHVDVLGLCADGASMPSGSTLQNNLFVSVEDSNGNFQLQNATCDTYNTYHASFGFLWNESYKVNACQYYDIGTTGNNTNITCQNTTMAINMVNNPITLNSNNTPDATSNGAIAWILNPWQNTLEKMKQVIPFKWYYEIEDYVNNIDETEGTNPTVNITTMGKSVEIFNLSKTKTLIGNTAWDQLQDLMRIGLWLMFIGYAWARTNSLFQD